MKHDLDAARRFLELLDAPGAAFGFRTFADDKEHPNPDLIVNRFGLFADVADELARLNDRGAGIFVTVNALDGRGYRAENVTRVRALFVDFDEDGQARLDALREIAGPTPTVVIESSPGKFHVYWVPDREVPLAGFRASQQALIARFGSDEKIHDLPRVMRLPGFAHLKGAPFVTRIVFDDSDARANPIALVGGAPAAGVAPRAVVSASNAVRAARGAVGGSLGKGERNAGLTSLAGALRRRGAAVETILAALRVENATRCTPPLGDAELSTIAHSIGRKEPSADLGDFERDSRTNAILRENQGNVRLALARMDVAMSFDEFADRLLYQQADAPPELLDDPVVSRLWLELDRAFGWRPPETFFRTVVLDEARAHTFHPVRNYLDGLEWDGKRRVHRWLVDYFGVEDSAYSRAVGTCLLVAAVRRIRRPGTKFDEMLVLEGDQGSGKSTGIEALVPDTSWFTDDLPLNSESKETIERTTGRWIVEAAELGGLRRADVERLKSFLSRRTDTARLAYGRMATERARHFVVIGTTNDAAYLNDSTGNRRFWPVAVGRIDVPAIARDRDQLWAEAARLEARGQVVRLDPRLWQRAVAAQEERRLEDPWEQELGALLGARVGWLQSQDAWALVGLHDVGRRAQAEGARLGKALRKLGFERVKRKRAGSLSWWYYRGARFTNGGYAIQDQIQVVVRRDGEGRLSTEIRESGDVPF